MAAVYQNILAIFDDERTAPGDTYPVSDNRAEQTADCPDEPGKDQLQPDRAAPGNIADKQPPG